MPFHHCTIIGLGLLGGSLALNLRAHYPDMRITGVARRQATLDDAAALRHHAHPVFSALTTELAAVGDADLVVICTPVQTIIQQLAEIAPLLRPGTVVTDVGSTKRAVMNAAHTVLPDTVTFIGGHPMAGSDRAGLEHARLGLFHGATWACCIPAGAEAQARPLALLIKRLGAQPLIIDADTHDAIVALTSHLSHVVAGAVTNVVLTSAYDDAVRPFIAGGFRDTTRIAASHPGMWRDIMLTNRDVLLTALTAFLNEVGQWRDAIRAADAPHLEALLTLAHDRRETLNPPKD